MSHLEKWIVEEFVGQAGAEYLRERFAGMRPSIVAKMREKGITPGAVGLPFVVRDALFRYWKGIVRSGDVADLIRDRQEERVTERVVLLLDGSLTASADLDTVVGLTARAVVEALF